MVARNEIPAIIKSYDLTLWTLNHTARFPRHHRYSLGQRIESTLQDLLDLLVEARSPCGLDDRFHASDYTPEECA